MNKSINTIFLGLLTLIAVGAVLHILKSVFLPLVIAILLSFILAPLVKFFQKIFPRFVAVIVVVGILIIFIYFLGWTFYSSINSFIAVLGYYQERFDFIIGQIIAKYNLPPNILDAIPLSSGIKLGLYNFSLSFMSFAGQFILVMFFLIFMLLEEPSASIAKIERAFKREDRGSQNLKKIISKISSQLSRYLTVKLSISIITGLFVGVSLYFIGLDFYLMWGFLAVLLNFIPNIGSTLIMLATILMSFIQFYPSPNPILATFITMPLIQMIFGNFLDPKLQGEQLDLSPVVILISLVFWGWIWGIAGMFLAVPLTETIKILCVHIDTLKPISILMSSGKPLKVKPQEKCFEKQESE